MSVEIQQGDRSRPTDRTGSTNDDVNRQTVFIALSTIVVSVANYLFALVVVRFLSTADYVDYASVQSLLLVLGTGCMAAVPWSIAQYLARATTIEAEAVALRFGLVAALTQGLVFAGAALLLVAPSGGWGLAVCTAVAALTMSLVAAPLGVLQGAQRIGTIAVLRLVETAARLAVSVLLLVLVAAAPQSPVIGFTIGSAVLLLVGLLLCRRAWSFERAPSGVFPALLRKSVGFAVLQISLAAVGAVDTVVIVYASLGGTAASAYQVTALAGRIPLFLSAAVAMTWFQRIAAAPDNAMARLALRGALRQYLLLATPAALAVLSAPPVLLELLAPGRGDDLWRLTPWTAAIGWGVGILTIMVTEHQARSRVRRAVVLVLPVALVQPLILVISGRVGGVVTFAGAGVLAVLISLALLLGDLGLHWLQRCLGRREAAALSFGGCLALGARLEGWVWPLAVLVLTYAVVQGTLSARHAHRAKDDRRRPIDGRGAA